MLMDMLGILTGFIAIMLLFSLLVTALVQGAQAALDLRFKNLKSVIDHFLKGMSTLEANVAEKIMDQLEKRFTSGLLATALPLNISSNRLKVTNIGKQELVDIINSTPGVELDQKEQLRNKISDHFDTVEEIMRQRFKQWMHQISIAIAFLICFTFQLNCFQLLSQLNEDAAMRYQAITLAHELSNSDELPEKSETQLQSKLHALDFKITPHAWKAYYFSLNIESLTHWLGVIFSSILVSLGAPFWFNRLKDMASLRDQLSKIQNKK